MNVLSILPKGLTRAFGKLWLKTKNASPEICVGTGIILGGAALVMVGVKTWKGKETLSEDISRIKATNEEVKQLKSSDAEAEENTEIATLEDVKKERRSAYIRSAFDIVKMYWLPAVLGASSVIFIWGGRTMLRKELSAYAAAYATLMETYNRYRQKVAKEIGEEKEQALNLGANIAQLPDPKDADKTITAPVMNRNENSNPYAFYFDPGEWDEGSREWIWRNMQWSRDNIANQLRITNAQNYGTDQLISRGWYSLGELAESLGAKPNPFWYRVGWIYKKGRDNIVELGVLEGPHQLPFNRGFMDITSPQNVAIINPNVDGCIDCVFEDIEKYDKRCGKRSNGKTARVPSLETMYGEEMAQKIWKDGGLQ